MNGKLKLPSNGWRVVLLQIYALSFGIVTDGAAFMKKFGRQKEKQHKENIDEPADLKDDFFFNGASSLRRCMQ